MDKYLYLSVTPEALISSMLSPQEFGSYLATGTKKRSRGQAVFFEVDAAQAGDLAPAAYIEQHCKPHPNGTPKHSLYLSIYRVLERVPLSALKNLYLTTDDGRVLTIQKQEYKAAASKGLHLYQELCPVTPRIASSLEPEKFMKYVTNPENKVSVPSLFFVELELGALTTDPVAGTADDLPYPNIPHLRDCLVGLQHNDNKTTKTVIRYFNGDVPYRTCKGGFYVGSHTQMLFYPFPTREKLEMDHHAWWRSALTLGFN
jgi:hypothetical protein